LTQDLFIATAAEFEKEYWMVQAARETGRPA
jgi:hypothetical protein